MKTVKLPLIYILLLAFSFDSPAQNITSLYLGITEGIGIAHERQLPKNLSLDLKASFLGWRNAGNTNWNGGRSLSYITISYFDIYAKRYVSGENYPVGLYYGGYLRYFTQGNFRQGWGRMNNEQQQSIQEMYNMGSKTTKTSITNKISLGFIAGKKWLLSDKISLDLTGGIGFSPPPIYWEKNKYYFAVTDRNLVDPDSLIGYFGHMSFIAGLSFRYRLDKLSKGI